MIIELARLTQEIQTRTVTINGKDKTVLNNRIAVKDNKGQSVFMDVTAWDKLAEFIAAHFQKGDEFYFEGYLRNKDFVIDDTHKIQIPYILLDKVRFTHGKQEEKES